MEMFVEPHEFSFSVFYQGTIAIYFCDLIETKLLHAHSHIPLRLRQQLMIAIRTIIRFRFQVESDYQQQMVNQPFLSSDPSYYEPPQQSSDWFSIHIKADELEPRVYPESITEYELVPICFPMVLSAQCCLQSNRGKYWKLEIKGVMLVDEYVSSGTTNGNEIDGSNHQYNNHDNYKHGFDRGVVHRTVLTSSPLIRDLIIRAIQDCSLFSAYHGELDEEQWDALLSRFEMRVVQSGDIIVHKGDIGDYFYVIESGQYSVVFDMHNKSMTTKKEKLTMGNYFGEVALLHQTIRGCNIVAESEGIVWRIHSRDIKRDVMINIPSEDSEENVSINFSGESPGEPTSIYGVQTPDLLRSQDAYKQLLEQAVFRGTVGIAESNFISGQDQNNGTENSLLGRNSLDGQALSEIGGRRSRSASFVREVSSPSSIAQSSSRVCMSSQSSASIVGSSPGQQQADDRASDSQLMFGIDLNRVNEIDWTTPNFKTVQPSIFPHLDESASHLDRPIGRLVGLLNDGPSLRKSIAARSFEWDEGKPPLSARQILEGFHPMSGVSSPRTPPVGSPLCSARSGRSDSDVDSQPVGIMSGSCLNLPRLTLGIGNLHSANSASSGSPSLLSTSDGNSLTSSPRSDFDSNSGLLGNPLTDGVSARIHNKLIGKVSPVKVKFTSLRPLVQHGEDIEPLRSQHNSNMPSPESSSVRSVSYDNSRANSPNQKVESPHDEGKALQSRSTNKHAIPHLQLQNSGASRHVPLPPQPNARFGVELHSAMEKLSSQLPRTNRVAVEEISSTYSGLQGPPTRQLTRATTKVFNSNQESSVQAGRWSTSEQARHMLEYISDAESSDADPSDD